MAEHDQHALTKKNNALMIRMDRKREKNRVMNESKSKALHAKMGKGYKRGTTHGEVVELKRQHLKEKTQNYVQGGKGATASAYHERKEREQHKEQKDRMKGHPSSKVLASMRGKE